MSTGDWRDGITEELKRADAKRDPAEAWMWVAGFWIGLVLFLMIVWVVVGSVSGVL